MLQFALNLSLTMRERPWAERFTQAARLGFSSVEFWWPHDETPAQIVRMVRADGLAVALFNLDGGDLAAGERGLLNNPARLPAFRAGVPAALELAHAVGCRRLNALVGCALPGVDRQVQLARVAEELAWLCTQAAPAGISILVEALNTWDTPGYLVTSTVEALALIAQVGAPNLAYQYDVYHMQRMEGEPAAMISRHAERIGHIQIADEPGRGPPGSGRLPFRTIFAAIAASPYRGAIGLEYLPGTDLEASLAWLPPDRRGPLTLADLHL